MEMKKCFGRYIFEDIECMQCSDCSACQMSKRNKELEAKKLRYPKECHDCPDFDHCREGKAHNCLGNKKEFGQSIFCDSCKCRYNCYNKCKEETTMLCIKPVKCRIHDSKQFIPFKAGERYEINIVGTRLYAKDRNGYFEKIFNDYNNEIVSQYFIIEK